LRLHKSAQVGTKPLWSERMDLAKHREREGALDGEVVHLGFEGRDIGLAGLGLFGVGDGVAMAAQFSGHLPHSLPSNQPTKRLAVDRL
jgi:hypothetical protein